MGKASHVALPFPPHESATFHVCCCLHQLLNLHHHWFCMLKQLDAPLVEQCYTNSSIFRVNTPSWALQNFAMYVNFCCFRKIPKNAKTREKRKKRCVQHFFRKIPKNTKMSKFNFAEFRGVSRGPPRTPKTPKNRSHAVRGVSRSFAEFRGVSRGGLCAIIDIFEKMVERLWTTV